MASVSHNEESISENIPFQIIPWVSNWNHVLKINNKTTISSVSTSCCLCSQHPQNHQVRKTRSQLHYSQYMTILCFSVNDLHLHNTWNMILFNTWKYYWYFRKDIIWRHLLTTYIILILYSSSVLYLF